jgi:hypothetical protein
MSSTVSRFVPLTLAAALAFSVAACETGTDPRTGSVSILLTDAPGEVVEAWVTITDIYLQGQVAGEDEGEEGADDPQGGRVYLLQDADETHELLSLANTVEELVSGVEVPVGHYGQLRMVITGGCILTADDAVYASSPDYDLCGERTGTLKMPSYAQSGAKVVLHGFQVTGGEQAIVLDFDVSQSFGRLAGQSGMWVMNPVIRATQLQSVASIETTLSAGSVTLPDGYALEQFSATLTPAEGDTSRVTFHSAGGKFRANFEFLAPEQGPFQVRLNAPDGLTVTVSPESPQSVSPAAGESVEIDWVLQSAST